MFEEGMSLANCTCDICSGIVLNLLSWLHDKYIMDISIKILHAIFCKNGHNDNNESINQSNNQSFNCFKNFTTMC